MKSLVLLTVLIVLSGVIFTSYKIMSYEPPNISKYMANMLDEVTDIDLEGNKNKDYRRDNIVSKTKMAVDVYIRFGEDLPDQVKPAWGLLLSMIQQGKLPAYFIKVPRSDEMSPRSRSFELLDFAPDNYIEVSARNTPLTCEDIDNKLPTDMKRYELRTLASGRKEYFCVSEPCPQYEYADILIGDTASNTMSCNPVMKEYSGDQLYVSGPGNDKIMDKYGNKIIVPGSGDDVLILGGGRKIIIFDDSWGKDKVKMDCTHASVNLRSVLSAGAPVFWKYKYTNFIIFGPTVNPDDMHWENNQVLENKRTGDTITFAGAKCFNFIFSMDEI